MIGARVTDAVEFYAKRGESRGAVRIVRLREPDRFRWRKAVSGLSSRAGKLLGRDRMRIEEPVREVVLDLERELQREVVLDARRYNVDLDRGELLPYHTTGDLRRFCFLVGTDVNTFNKYVRVSNDFQEPIDTAGCTVVARAMSNHHRRRAQRIWLELPDPDGPEKWRMHHRFMSERAGHDAELARRWNALAGRLVKE